MTRPITAAEKIVTELQGIPRGNNINQPPTKRPARTASLQCRRPVRSITAGSSSLSGSIISDVYEMKLGARRPRGAPFHSVITSDRCPSSREQCCQVTCHLVDGSRCATFPCHQERCCCQCPFP